MRIESRSEGDLPPPPHPTPPQHPPPLTPQLEPCTQEEEQLISKDTAAYLAADRSPEAVVMILDGAFVVQMLCHRTSNTFQDYSNSPVLPYLFGQLQSVRRLDIASDVYLAYSLKAGTRSKRGQGQRRKVLPLAPSPST